LQLDALAFGAQDEATAAHAATCPECTAHLNAVKVQLPVPTWVQGVDVPRRGQLWRLAFAVAAMATVAVIGFVVPGRVPAGPPAVTPKGTPEVQVWVNRSGHAAVWDGVTPLHPGDMVRFDIASGGYSHLTVAELADGQLATVLHSAPVATREASPAWRVDDVGTREEIAVLLSNGPLSEEEVRAALKSRGAIWTKQWLFPKEK
jgi:hypothetical protein